MKKKTVIIIVIAVLAVCICAALAIGLGVAYYVSQKNTAPTPTPTPVITTVPIPERVTSLTDTFDNNNNGWDTRTRTGNYSVTNEYISAGKLHLDSTASDSVLVYDTLATQPIYDLDLSVQARQTSGPKDADEALVFRRVDNENYYVFSVSEGLQQYSLSIMKAGDWNYIIDWQSSSQILSNQPNTLRVVTSGTKISLYINGTLVNTITDTAIVSPGLVGLGADYYNAGDQGTFEFDNFSIKVL